MTREEQIHNQATNYGYAVAGGSTMRPPVSKAFLEGAKWADANQPSPWISVEERLPEKGVLVIVKTGIGNCYLGAKDSVALPKDEFVLPQLCDYVDGVTHWMPIPELQEE